MLLTAIFRIRYNYKHNVLFPIFLAVGYAPKGVNINFMSWSEGGKYIWLCCMIAGGYLSHEAFSARMTRLSLLPTPIQLYRLLKGISD
jgi:hypothetical protein